MRLVFFIFEVIVFTITFKKGEVALRTNKVIGINVSCLLIVVFIFGYQYTERTEETGFFVSKTKKVEQFEEQVIETGLIDKMGERLFEKGYTFVLDWEALSKNEMKVVINLPDKSISEVTKTNVESIITEFLIASNVDPVLFKIEVANNSMLNYLCAPE